MAGQILFILDKVVKLINAVFIIIVLFFERKNSTRRFSWLLFLFFLPWVGWFFYILFSGHFFAATRRMEQVNNTISSLTKPLRMTQLGLIREALKRKPNPQALVYKSLIETNLKEGNALLLTSQDVQFYTNGTDFFNALCCELENARNSITMEYFIFHNDKIGNKVMDILCRKAQQGVDVKLIYDDLGSLFTPTKFFRRLNNAGGKARPFLQIRIGLPFSLNYRNHRKRTVIDSRTAFIGGINIGDEYANQNKHSKLNWRDTVVKVTGDSVINLQMNFLMDWYSMDVWHKHSRPRQEIQSYFPKEITQAVEEIVNEKSVEKLAEQMMAKEGIPTQIVTAGPAASHKSNIEDTLIRMIMGAKKNVYIQTPYFTPDGEFYTALKLASYAGVDVQVMIPSQWDKFYMKAASSEFAREMLGEGVKFHLYPGFIHAKMVTIDGMIATIGTTNIDERSFKLHYEENIIFYSPGAASACNNIFKRDVQKCRQITQDYYNKQPIYRRAFWSFCKLFSPFM